MATTHETDYLEGAWPVLLEQYGEEVTYTPASTGVAATVSTIVDRGKTRVRYGENDEAEAATAEVSVGREEVAAPELDDAVTFDSKVWYVRAVQESGGVYMLTVETADLESVGNITRSE